MNDGPTHAGSRKWLHMIANHVKTFVLLGFLSALVLVAGQALGGETGLLCACALALVLNIGSYFFADKIVLRMYGARPLDGHSHHDVYEMVGELTRAMDIPVPRLWLIPGATANAFATGRNPGNASVAVTEGILDMLDARELRGVLAHELSHVKNRDILVSTVAATLATAVSYLANMVKFNALFGSSRDRREGSGPFAIFVVIFMPLAAMLVQLAISRSREYLADESAAHYSSDPLALASALEKLHYSSERDRAYASVDMNKAATASLFIVNPLSSRGIVALFSTHPPVIERIRRLRQMHTRM